MTEVHEIEEEHYYIKPDNCVEYEEDAENVEQVEEEEKIILIVPTEDAEKVDWSVEATQALILYLNEKLDLVISGVLKNLKQMWEKVSQELVNSNYLYTAEQCDNKWKSLKRSYLLTVQKNKKLPKGQKRTRPFDKDIQEIIRKRQKLKSYLKQDTDMAPINVHMESKPKIPIGRSSKREKELLVSQLKDYSAEYNKIAEKEEMLTKKSIDTLSKIHAHVDGIQKKVYKNDTYASLRSVYKTLEIHDDICLQLDAVKDKLAKAKALSEMALDKDQEMLEEIKQGNNLLASYLEKLENPK